MNFRNHILAIIVGASVPWLAVSLIGSLAARPTPGHNWIELYSFVISALPTVVISSVASLLLVFFGARETTSYVLAYAAAIASFLALMNPWLHVSGLIAGLSVYWDQYLYMLIVPVLGLALTNSSLKSGEA